MKALKMMAGAGGRRNASMQRFSGCFVGKTWKHFRANLGVTAETCPAGGISSWTGAQRTQPNDAISEIEH
jgi:hypothetical protein